jgi:hypothetical protein
MHALLLKAIERMTSTSRHKPEKISPGKAIHTKTELS